MATPVQICNSALLKIGEPRINSLSDNTKAAIACNEQYEKLRNEVLRAHPWNFAIKRAELASVATAPVYGFDQAYQIPTDCLRILGHEGEEYDRDYKVEGDKVLTNTSEFKIRYISLIEDTSKYDENFQEALALRIAADLAYYLTQSTSLKSQLLQEYELSLSRARSYDAQEGFPEDIGADFWINQRL
jgi:hypothetical protein